MIDAYEFADCDQGEGDHPAGDMAWGDGDDLDEDDPESDDQSDSEETPAPDFQDERLGRREARRGSIDVSWFAPEHAAIMEAVFRSRSNFGCIPADGLDSEDVVTLVTAGWLEWWPGRSLLTFTPQTAAALKVRLMGAGWQSTARKAMPAPVSKRSKEVSATSAGIDLDGNPVGWTPRNHGGMNPPSWLVGLTRTWDGPLLARKCPTCGNAPYRAGGGPYCVECDCMPPEAKAARRKGVA